MADLRFRPEYHLRRGVDFRRVYRRRVKASDPLILICACENGLDHPRLGLSVSRKVGPAVVRNRWKRLLREAFRLTRADLPAGVDLVVIPRPGVDPKLGPLQESFRRLARRVEQKLLGNRR